MKYAGIALAAALALGGCEGEQQEPAAAAEAEAGRDEIAAGEAPAAHPPLGRYVCRQYMTTIGWIDLTESTYAVGDVEGGYSYDPANGEVEWNGGAYVGWPARYELSPAGEGHAHDERIIRMTDETGKLKIDCFLTAE